MCILESNIASGLVPKYTIELAGNIPLLTAMVAYQKNPGTETYNAVTTVLQSITDEYNKVLFTLNGSTTVLSIFDSNVKMLWFTGNKSLEKYIASVYTDKSYNISGDAVGTVFKQFEDGFKLQGGWAGGFPLFEGGRPSLTFAVTILDKSLIATANLPIAEGEDLTRVFLQGLDNSGSFSEVGSVVSSETSSQLISNKAAAVLGGVIAGGIGGTIGGLLG